MIRRPSAATINKMSASAVDPRFESMLGAAYRTTIS